MEDTYHGVLQVAIEAAREAGSLPRQDLLKPGGPSPHAHLIVDNEPALEISDADAQWVLSGLQPGPHLVRAVLEGVAYNTRWLLQYVEKFVKRRLEAITVVGGGARSELFVQAPALVRYAPVDVSMKWPGVITGLEFVPSQIPLKARTVRVRLCWMETLWMVSMGQGRW